MKRIFLLAGAALMLTGCSGGGSDSYQSGRDDRLIRERQCREIGMDMRSDENANARADISAVSLARSNSDYIRLRCSDFEKK